MTRNEKRLLSAQLKALRARNRYAWWELKRQIFEGGYQDWYPAQGDFLPGAERLIERLEPEVRSALIAEQRLSKHGISVEDEQTALAGYPLMIVAEIVERARVAAYRTSNW